jgi:hypothetical protein
VNHSKIAICVSVMNEVRFLFASKPCKPLKPRFLDVVFLVEKDMRVKRRRAGDYLCVPKTSSNTLVLAGPRWLTWRRLVCRPLRSQFEYWTGDYRAA